MSVLSVCISTGVGGFLEEAGFTLNSKIMPFTEKKDIQIEAIARAHVTITLT